MAKNQPPPLPKGEPPTERWIRLEKRNGSTAVFELTTQGDRIVGRRTLVERDIRTVQYAKAMIALEERAG